MAKARVKVPKSVTKDEVFEVKSLVSHKMETGLRKHKKTKKKIPRDIINKFSVNYGGKEVFSADWHPAISANPYTSFYVKASESGPMVLTWTDDAGKVTEKTVKIKVVS
jgi:sulfur-oxidizing protein SoxZ